MAIEKVQKPEPAPTKDISLSYVRQNNLMESLYRGVNNIHITGSFPNFTMKAGSFFEVEGVLLSSTTDTALPPITTVPSDTSCIVLSCKSDGTTRWVANDFGTYNPIYAGYYTQDINTLGQREEWRCLDYACVLTTAGNSISKVTELGIGSMYTRYPNTNTPTALGYGGAWNNVSSRYASLFFRVEGGIADPFNSSTTQLDATRRVNGNISTTSKFVGSSTFAPFGFTNSTTLNYYEIANTTLQLSSTVAGDRNNILSFDNQKTLGSTHISTEIRPANKSIQIYERVS